jgi:hypothetical protein
VTSRHQAKSSPPRPARLVCDPSRAQAQARYLAMLGRVHRAPSRGVSLFSLLRALPWVGIAMSVTMRQAHIRRQQAVCRLRRQHGADDRRPAHRPKSVRRRFSSPSRAPPIQPYAEASWTEALADRIGAIPEPSQRSAACPNCWCRNNTKVAVIKARDAAAQEN